MKALYLLMLWASPLMAQSANLAWYSPAAEEGVVGYEIERCQGEDCSDFANIATVGVVSAYMDSTVVYGETYQYRVLAFDAAGNKSAYSNTGVAVLGAAPDPNAVAMMPTTNAKAIAKSP